MSVTFYFLTFDEVNGLINVFPKCLVVLMFVFGVLLFGRFNCFPFVCLFPFDFLIVIVCSLVDWFYLQFCIVLTCCIVSVSFSCVGFGCVRSRRI